MKHHRLNSPLNSKTLILITATNEPRLTNQYLVSLGTIKFFKLPIGLRSLIAVSLIVNIFRFVSNDRGVRSENGIAEGSDGRIV